MSNLIKEQINKDNKNSKIFFNRKSLDEILSNKKNITNEKIKSNKSENNNNNDNDSDKKIKNQNVSNTSNDTSENKKIENKNKSKEQKKKNKEMIYIIFYDIIGVVILFHSIHYIFSLYVSNNFNIFIVYYLFIFIYKCCSF